MYEQPSSYITLLGWFSNKTGTSVDDGARKLNKWLDQWQSANWVQKSWLVLSARFPVVDRRSRPVAKSAYLPRLEVKFYAFLVTLLKVWYRLSRYGAIFVSSPSLPTSPPLHNPQIMYYVMSERHNTMLQNEISPFNCHLKVTICSWRL